MTGLLSRVEAETATSVPSPRHQTEVLDTQADEWVCAKCGNRRPVRRDAQGRALARQGTR